MTELRAGLAGEAGFREDRLDLLRERAASWVADGRVSSLVVLAARRGVVALHESYGRRTPDSTSDDMTTDAVYPVMSLTKPVTAAAAMVLVEDGLLSLNRPVRDYIPEISAEGADDMLVHHLMTHSAGYNEADVIAHAVANPVSDLPPCEPTQHPYNHKVLNDRYSAPLSFTPGSQNSYGIHCMTLLGEIVRRVSGMPYDEFVESRLFAPIGMNDSAFASRPHTEGRRVVRGEGQPFGNDDFFVNFERLTDVPAAGGGLLSTAWDMAIFCQTFLNRGEYAGQRILTGVTCDEMTRNQIPGIPCIGWGGRQVEEASWGLGWMVQDNERWPFWTGSLQPLGTVYHQGIGNSMMWFDKETEVVGVMLCAVNEFDFETFRASWDVDLFQNMVSTSLAD